MNEPLLELKDVALGYGGKELYSGVNLRVGEGEMVALLGANGAGKSTLLRCITGSLPPLHGSVEIAGRLLAGIPRKELARLVSLVNTGMTMAGALTVRELVSLGRQPHTGFLGLMSHRDREIVDHSLEAVGMTAFSSRLVASLSDGERQKAMIARALAQETPVMVLDEPTAFLDVASRLETMQLLGTLAHDGNKAIILSTHDVASALRLCQRLWLIERPSPQSSELSGDDASSHDAPGPRTIIDGTPSSLIDSGALSSLFSGRRVRFDPSLMDFLPESY